MIEDQETNVVFVADTLERSLPAVYYGLVDILGRHGIPLRMIPGTRSIWCRDYLPIQVSEDRFVQFRYAPDYLTGKYRHLRADGQIGSGLPYVKNCERSEIVLDGGNLVSWTDKVVVCEKVFAENPGQGPAELIQRLGSELGVDRVIVIPTEPGDVVGHADGVVRFYGGNSVLVNDYRGFDPTYRRELLGVLKGQGLSVTEVPYRPTLGKTRGIPPATGCYLNYLRVAGLVVCPTYGMAEDRVVMELLGNRLGVVVHGLDCRDLALDGGAVHCVTWNIRLIPVGEP